MGFVKLTSKLLSLILMLFISEVVMRLSTKIDTATTCSLHVIAIVITISTILINTSTMLDIVTT
jgi:hypothetical protein